MLDGNKPYEPISGLQIGLGAVAGLAGLGIARRALGPVASSFMRGARGVAGEFAAGYSGAPTGVAGAVSRGRPTYRPSSFGMGAARAGAAAGRAGAAAGGFISNMWNSPNAAYARSAAWSVFRRGTAREGAARAARGGLGL